MQDGATCHTAHSTIDWLAFKKIDIIQDWPPRSPDLNPIQNVWGILKDHVDTNNITSAQEFFERIKKEWDALTKEEIRNLILKIFI